MTIRMDAARPSPVIDDQLPASTVALQLQLAASIGRSIAWNRTASDMGGYRDVGSTTSGRRDQAVVLLHPYLD
ncbi:hypothetical protein V8C44DRAFT_316518, partial [Trichoderma aethiopicum]